MTNTLKSAVLALCLVAFAGAQTPVTLMPVPKPQYFTNAGAPLAFGCLFTYQANTTTPLATFNSSVGNVQNQNPVILDSAGRASVWIQAGQAYTVLVKASGGTHCASGSTLYTVDGIGGGVTTLTTVVTYSASPVFTVQSQNQLFEITLTGDATAQPLTAVGITPPAIVTFEITQDGSGGHLFTWPANTVGGATICSTAGCTTQQTFIWNGTQGQAVGPASYTTGNAFALMDLYDFGLSASATVCTNSSKKLVSSCSTPYTVTYNGQSVAPGGSGNVNVGAAAHSMALNQGNGSAITGLALTNNQIPMGVTSSDPVAKSVPTCAATQALTFDGTTWSCLTLVTVQDSSITTLGAPVGVTTATTVLTKSVTMPSTGCPCRAFVGYGAFSDFTNSGQIALAVNDGTNTFATAQSNTTGSASEVGTSASSFSTGTYSNGASITFTLQGSKNSAGTVNVHVSNGPGLGQATWMNVSIFTSN